MAARFCPAPLRGFSFFISEPVVSTTGLLPLAFRAVAGVEFYETVSTFSSASGPAVVDRLGSSEIATRSPRRPLPDEELIRFIRTAIMQIHRGLRRFFRV